MSRIAFSGGYRAFVVLLLAVGRSLPYQSGDALRALAVSPLPFPPSSPASVTATAVGG
jgi:hypothetical protein